MKLTYEALSHDCQEKQAFFLLFYTLKRNYFRGQRWFCGHVCFGGFLWRFRWSRDKDSSVCAPWFTVEILVNWTKFVNFVWNSIAGFVPREKTTCHIKQKSNEDGFWALSAISNRLQEKRSCYDEIALGLTSTVYWSNDAEQKQQALSPRKFLQQCAPPLVIETGVYKRKCRACYVIRTTQYLEIMLTPISEILSSLVCALAVSPRTIIVMWRQQ